RSSGYPCTSTGTFSPDSLMVSAMPFSSPKFGSTTRIPSISDACFLNKAAHFCASAKVSTPPSLVSSSLNRMGFICRSLKRSVISFLAVATSLSGKKSRLPIIMPSVAGCLLLFSIANVMSTCYDQFNFVILQHLFVLFFDPGVGNNIIDQGKRAQACKGGFAYFSGVRYQVGHIRCFDHGFFYHQVADAGIGKPCFQGDACCCQEQLLHMQPFKKVGRFLPGQG